MEAYTPLQWLLIFFVYSVLGWVWESCYVSVKSKRWVNRGFLHGPWLPIYGSGAVVVLLVTLPARGRPALIFLLGMIGTALGCLVTGIPADTYCLSLSLLLAFAMLYPEVQVLLFFVIPIKVKYFGLFAGALWAFSFLMATPLGKVNYLLGMLGFVVFFGPQAGRSVRAWVRREQWKRKNKR